VNARRIDAGVAFWRTHAATLDRAARTFGVPAEVVVAIIGVETEYGRQTGSFGVLDALATLAFDYPRRADYFRAELEQYLLYTRESGLDATALKGSYAGAIGLPQFMPGSIRRFGVDFDGDGRRDLRASRADAIGSVANFLAAHGWVAGAPVAVPAAVQGEAYRAFANGEVVPIYRPEVLQEAGVELAAPVDPDAPCVLIELESPDAPPVHLVGLQNFYALTRYNRSSFYAAAVNELAEELKVAYRAR
jgi:membrane-bound lytic murein transglycosylase B